VRVVGEYLSACDQGCGYPTTHSPGPQRTIDEFARLAGAFNEMADRLQASYAQLEQQLADLEQETAEREWAEAEHERLQQEIIETQKQAIQDLSTPVIPVNDFSPIYDWTGGHGDLDPLFGPKPGKGSFPFGQRKDIGHQRFCDHLTRSQEL
jgi:hypothetical protein